MKIIQKIVVKQVVTKASKAALLRTFSEQKMQLEQEHQQLMFEQRKLESNSRLSKREIIQRFKIEHDKRKRKIKLIDFKVEQLEILPIGSEVVEKEVEALVEVSVGSDWSKLTKRKIIVVKDGLVIRIEE